MAMSADTAAVAGRRRHRRRPVMAEINVTPMVDVMLVLLIIFMVAAPLLTVSIPVDLPEAKATITTKAKTEQLTVTARKALRLLDDLRVEHNGLDRPIPLGHDGGTLMVELNHISAEVLPAGFRGGDNDSRILAVAKNLANEGRDVTVVSKDLPMRV